MQQLLLARGFPWHRCGKRGVEWGDATKKMGETATVNSSVLCLSDMPVVLKGRIWYGDVNVFSRRGGVRILSKTCNGQVGTMLPKGILKYIKEHHVLHLCTVSSDGSPWGCNVFYVFDEEDVRFFSLTELKTHHGQNMAADPRIAGTVTAHPRFIASIQGVQFSGKAKHLEGAEAKFAYDMYYKRFPIARVMNAPIWELRPDYVKMTSNKVGFAFKEDWTRPEEQPAP